MEEVPHPLDREYQLLKCQLQLLDPETPEYKVGQAPQRSQASSGRCSSACLPSRCPEGSLALGLISLSPDPEESPGTGGREEVGPHASCS